MMSLPSDPGPRATEHPPDHQQDQLRLLVGLAELSRTTSAQLSADALLHALARICGRVLQADQCVIYLWDATPGRLLTRASAFPLGVLDGGPSSAGEQMRNTLQDLGKPRRFSRLSQQDRERLGPLWASRYQTILVAPLMAGDELLGVIASYYDQVHPVTVEEDLLMGIIADQVALALKCQQLSQRLDQRNLVAELVDDLVHGTEASEEEMFAQARAVGVNLANPHVLMLMFLEPGALQTTSEKRKERIEHVTAGFLWPSFQKQYPGSLIHRQEHLLTCLLPVPEAFSLSRLKAWVADVAQRADSEQEVSLYVGVSLVCRTIADYPGGFAQASAALQMAQSLGRTGAVSFNDIGVLRYLQRRPSEAKSIPYLAEIARIASYDATKKNRQLMLTLETFLECEGNQTATSAKLSINLQTLRQRLQRITIESGLNVTEPRLMVPLTMAIQEYRSNTGQQGSH